METYEFSYRFELGALTVAPVHVRIERLPPVIAAHQHSNISYEIHYTRRGRGDVTIDALTRRGQNYQGEQVTFGDLVLDRSGYALRAGDKSCQLSHREYHLIELFMRNPHIYFSADTLLDRVWGMDADVEYGTVWVHISGLRKKLESLNSKAEIRSKRGVGYALEEIE